MVDLALAFDLGNARLFDSLVPESTRPSRGFDASRFTVTIAHDASVAAVSSPLGVVLVHRASHDAIPPTVLSTQDFDIEYAVYNILAILSSTMEFSWLVD
jgi:hypothetical protein